MTITLQHVKSTDSTNRQIKQLNSQQPLTHGYCLFADFQTAGKGQGTNNWESAEGENLLFSVWLDTQQFPVAEQFLLSEVIASATAQALQQYLPEVELKWPNDIYVGNKKLGGILIETIIKNGMMEHAIAGIGLNVNQTTFISDAPNPISMKQLLGKDVDREQLLAEIVTAIALGVGNFTYEQRDEWQHRYDSILFWRDGVHRFQDKDGDFQAKILRVESNGQLVLETTTHNIKRYFLKEVRFII
ncbi:MAG: biotin--[acetyl-CoA-carboxylase] ligase [Bacteroidales bacterium]|nr:biotin--[acetyl-CoA-carboxylase] ligase [Bacteroidales bacterium]